LGFIRDDTQLKETFSPIIFYGTETEINVEKQNSRGNYVMGSFSVFILYQVKVKIRRMGGGGGENLHAWDFAKYVRTF
jgi:hypothetical protein